MEENTPSKVGTFLSSAMHKFISIIVVLVIIGLVSLVAWFWHNNQLLEQRTNDLQDQMNKFEEMNDQAKVRDVVIKEEVEGKVAENVEIKKDEVTVNNTTPSENTEELITYKNDELGISFDYPKNWGEVNKSKFDGSNKSEYFVFSNLKNAYLGGLHNDYWVNGPERGGSLIDPQGFKIKSSYPNNSKKIIIDLSSSKDTYKVSSSNMCAYSTSKEWFDGKVYYAICNLEKNEKLSGLNFAFGSNNELPEISEKDFINLVESVKVY